MASVLAFYSDNPSSNSAEAYSFSAKFVIKKNENKQIEAGVGPFKKYQICGFKLKISGFRSIGRDQQILALNISPK